jgi:hypothetical protein
MAGDRSVVVLIGHCGPDAWAIRSAIRNALRDVEFRDVTDVERLAEAMIDADLLLVNRVLDGSFRDTSGVELIRALADAGGAPPMMLVSNYEDAQAEAVAAGARPGFGKTQLYDARTRELIEAAVSRRV